VREPLVSERVKCNGNDEGILDARYFPCNDVQHIRIMLRIHSLLLVIGVISESALVRCHRPEATAKERISLSDPEVWSRRLKCRELGDATERGEAKSESEAESRTHRDISMLLAPEYCYSATLNTCIYESGWVPGLQSSLNFQHMAAKDLLTNQILVDANLPLGDPENDSQRRTVEDYKRKREELFRGCAK